MEESKMEVSKLESWVLDLHFLLWLLWGYILTLGVDWRESERVGRRIVGQLALPLAVLRCQI